MLKGLKVEGVEGWGGRWKGLKVKDVEGVEG
jgi:hypothetical protein